MLRGSILLAPILLLAACGTQKHIPFQPTTTTPDPDATFTRVKAQVFSTSCALSGCHAGSAPQAGLDLSPVTAYAALVGAHSTERADLLRVQPGDPGQSYLIRKLRGDADISGARMPLGGSITDAQLTLVTDWVLRGAPND